KKLNNDTKKKFKKEEKQTHAQNKQLLAFNRDNSLEKQLQETNSELKAQLLTEKEVRTMTKKILVIDGMALLFRHFYATSLHKQFMRNSYGTPTNVVQEFVPQVFTAINGLQ